jgi:hypothetical protein
METAPGQFIACGRGRAGRAVGSMALWRAAIKKPRQDQPTGPEILTKSTRQNI